MKQLLYILFAVTLFTACSSDDDNSKIDDVLANSQWESKPEIVNHTTQEYNNYNNEHLLQNILRICPSLKYTVGESKITEKIDSVDLCKRNSHPYHINAFLDFHTENCTLIEKSIRSLQIVESDIKETDYIFESGSYVGNLGGNNFVGIKVESSGIYQASTSGYILVLPLDGNYAYTVVSRKYGVEEKEQVLSVENHTLSFSRDNDKISIQNSEILLRGTLDASKTELSLINGNNHHTFLKKGN